MQVVVNQPPDLFNTTMRARFAKMMADFENTKYTMNHNATMIWLDASSEWYHRCRDWLLVAGGRRLWEKDMVWGQSEEVPSFSRFFLIQNYNDFYTLKRFRFPSLPQYYRTPTDHTNSCKLMREIASRYTDFNVTTFHEYYPFADQVGFPLNTV
ncbi:hypothetical protein COOONC_22067 [Cooperia oncophora]